MVWLLFLPRGAEIIELSPPEKMPDTNPGGIANTARATIKRVRITPGKNNMYSSRKAVCTGTVFTTMMLKSEEQV